MSCCIRPNPWLGKDMLFMCVAGALVRMQMAIPQAPNPQDLERFKEAAGILQSALHWIDFCNGKMSADGMAANADKAYRLLCEVAESSGVSCYAIFTIAKDATACLNGLVLGQAQSKEAIAGAITVCSGIGVLLTSRRMLQHECDDGDD